MYTEQQGFEETIEEQRHRKNQNSFFLTVLICALFIWSTLGSIIYNHVGLIPELEFYTKEKQLFVYRVLTFSLLVVIGMIHFYRKLFLKLLELFDRDCRKAVKLFDPLSTASLLGSVSVTLVSFVLTDLNPRHFQEMMTTACWVLTLIPSFYMVVLWVFFLLFLNTKTTPEVE